MPLSQSRNRGLALVLLSAIVLLVGCRKKGAAQPSEERPTAPNLATPPPSGGACAAVQGLLLPAGLHFRHHTFDTCSGPATCAAPTAAVLVGLARTAAAAERRTTAAERVRPALPPGYPLVVHTDELGLADATLDGVAVVAGLFRTPEDAQRWSAACTRLHPAARVLPLATSSVAFARLPPAISRRHYVVRISAGRPVPAYAEQDLEQLHPAAASAAVAARVTPLCTLKPGRLFVFNTRHIRWYRWAPVRCGDRKAYVRWTNTLLATTVLRRPGVTLLRQVTRVALGHPQLTTWRYDHSGRRPGAPSK